MLTSWLWVAAPARDAFMEILDRKPVSPSSVADMYPDQSSPSWLVATRRSCFCSTGTVGSASTTISDSGSKTTSGSASAAISGSVSRLSWFSGTDFTGRDLTLPGAAGSTGLTSASASKLASSSEEAGSSPGFTEEDGVMSVWATIRSSLGSFDKVFVTISTAVTAAAAAESHIQGTNAALRGFSFGKTEASMSLHSPSGADSS